MGLEDLHPILLAFLSSLFTWGTTALGASVVFCFGRHGFKPTTLDFLFGASAGVMLAASFFSLLMPSLALSRELSYPAFIPVLGGFLLGVGALELADWLIPENEPGGGKLCCFTSGSESRTDNFPLEASTGNETTFDDELNMSLESEVSTSLDDTNIDIEVTKQYDENSEFIDRLPKNMLLLVIAVTIHNLPEGFVVGVSFGSVYEQDNLTDALIQSMLLALAIGLQNIPEGAAVALPLKKAGLSTAKSFMYGQLSGFVEVIGALLGATMVFFVASILPYALSFAAGAMIYVVVKELIPRSQSSNKTVGNFGLVAGFSLMMTMEVAF